MPVRRIRYITARDIVRIHDKIIDAIGGEKGAINIGAIDYIVDYMLDRRYAVKPEQDTLYRAAFLLHAIIPQHPFIDGNKRTGFVVCKEFLMINGYELRYNINEAEELATGVGKGRIKERGVRKWVSSHSKRIKRTRGKY